MGLKEACLLAECQVPEWGFLPVFNTSHLASVGTCSRCLGETTECHLRAGRSMILRVQTS